jgi:hypothetical protein
MVLMLHTMNIFELNRTFWDFAFSNPEKIKPNHCAIYYFALEHCNRLGWKEKFGFPTSMVLEATGIKSYSVYKKTFDDLVSFGFFIVIEYSKNQYSSNIIALKENNKALDKALDKALIKHKTKQRESIDSIDKQLNKEQENNLTILHPLQIYINDNFIFVTKMKVQMTYENCEELIRQYPKSNIVDTLQAMENWKDLQKNTTVYLTALKWLKRDYNKGKTISKGQPSKMESMVNSAKEALNMLYDEN